MLRDLIAGLICGWLGGNLAGSGFSGFIIGMVFMFVVITCGIIVLVFLHNIFDFLTAWMR